MRAGLVIWILVLSMLTVGCGVSGDAKLDAGPTPEPSELDGSNSNDNIGGEVVPSDLSTSNDAVLADAELVPDQSQPDGTPNQTDGMQIQTDAPLDACAGDACQLAIACDVQTLCPDGTYCDKQSGTCQPGCSSSAQCPAGKNSIGLCLKNQCDYRCTGGSGSRICGTDCLRKLQCNSSCQCPQLKDGKYTCDGGYCIHSCKVGFKLCFERCIPQAELCESSQALVHSPYDNKLGWVSPSGVLRLFTLEALTPEMLESGTFNPSASTLPAIRQHVRGGDFTCSLDVMGEVYCYGPDSMVRNGFINLTAGDVIQLRAGHTHACALTSDGSVYCWGSNHYGQIDEALTPGAVTIAHKVPLVKDAVELSLGTRHSCALTKGGKVICWGDNTQGQRGGTALSGVVAGLQGMTLLTVGSWFSCASNGSTIYCWGSNSSGQLGLGADDDLGSQFPVKVPLASQSVVALSASQASACAISTNGTARCWGGGYAPWTWTTFEMSSFQALRLGKGSRCVLFNTQVYCSMYSDGWYGMTAQTPL